jgi:hypothetical protein
MINLAALKKTLQECFDPRSIRTVTLRLVEHGCLPSGTAGRAGSAEITAMPRSC